MMVLWYLLELYLCYKVLVFLGANWKLIMGAGLALALVKLGVEHATGKGLPKRQD